MNALQITGKICNNLTKCYKYIGGCNYFATRVPQINAIFRTDVKKSKYISFLFIWPFNTSKKNSIDTHIVDSMPSILESADHIFETGCYEECYNLLKSYEVQDDVQIKWRVCRVMYNMAKDPRYDKTFRKELLSQAFKIITEELDKNFDNSAVQKWYALLLDAKSSNEGIKEKIEQLQNIKKHMDLAVSLNPNDASLLHILGEWCYQITELPWYQRKTAEAIYATIPHSTYEEALEYFLKAESVQPRFYSVNLLRIGCCYLKLNRKDQAKYYLKLAASYPAKSDDDHHANKEAAELLKKLKK